MTPERAAEIAHKLRYKMALGQYAVDLIADSIVQACKEQKEMDANACAAISIKHYRTYKIDPGPNAYNPFFEGASDGAEECEQAIRGAE